MITVEIPKQSRNVSTQEQVYALSTWVRVVDHDGSTIAYVPDETTARRIAALFSKPKGDERMLLPGDNGIGSTF